MPDYKKTISTIYRYGGYRNEGQHAISSLVEGGEPAFDAFLIAREQPRSPTFMDVIWLRRSTT